MKFEPEIRNVIITIQENQLRDIMHIHGCLSGTDIKKMDDCDAVCAKTSERFYREMSNLLKPEDN